MFVQMTGFLNVILPQASPSLPLPFFKDEFYLQQGVILHSEEKMENKTASEKMSQYMWI